MTSTGTLGTTTVHILGSCPVKGCRNRRRVTVPDAPIRQTGIYTWTDWKIPAAGPYGEVHAHLGKGAATHQGWGSNPRPSQWLANNPHAYEQAWFAAVTDAGWICTDHDRFMVTTVIHGVVNAEKPCTARCKAATGPSCECVCGGAGHGSTWSI